MCSPGTRAALKPILVLGIGNLLMRDDGLGVHAARRFQALELPDSVEIFEGGTAGLDLLDVVAHRKKVIVVDAVRAPRSPGACVRLPLDPLAPPPPGGLSIHHLGILSYRIATVEIVHRIGRDPDPLDRPDARHQNESGQDHYGPTDP